MKAILIGSRALKFLMGSRFTRTPKDWDLIGDYETVLFLMSRMEFVCCIPYPEGRKYAFKDKDGYVECTLPSPGSSGEAALDGISGEFGVVVRNRVVASPMNLEFQAEVKRSHLMLPTNWDKHMSDYLLIRTTLDELVERFNPGKGMTWRLDDSPGSYYDLRRKEQLAKTKKSPSLMATKDEFFKDNVTYVFDHDSLHQAMKLYSKPGYEFLKKNTSEVFCEKDPWDKASHGVKMACLVEEAAVIALERSWILHLYRGRPLLDPRKAYQIALSKICTTLTSGWFREFAIDNIVEALGMYNEINPVMRFNRGLDNGVVKMLPPKSIPAEMVMA